MQVDVGDVCTKYENADTKCCTNKKAGKNVCMWAAFKGCVPAVSGQEDAISTNPPADPTCGQNPKSPFYVSCEKYGKGDTKCCTDNNKGPTNVCMWAAFKGCVPVVSGQEDKISTNPPADPTCGQSKCASCKGAVCKSKNYCCSGDGIEECIESKINPEQLAGKFKNPTNGHLILQPQCTLCD